MYLILLIKEIDFTKKQKKNYVPGIINFIGIKAVIQPTDFDP